MHGQALLARPRRAVPYGNRKLDAPRIARAGRRDQTQRQARRPRANGLEQRPDARVGERIVVADRLRRRQSRLAPRLGLRLGLGALGHSASASMSARNRGRRSTCATSAIARPELLTPLSLTSSPYLGWLPTGWRVVTSPMGSIDLSASSTSVTWTPSRWRLASQPAARTRWLVP